MSSGNLTLMLLHVPHLSVILGFNAGAQAQVLCHVFKKPIKLSAAKHSLEETQLDSDQIGLR